MRRALILVALLLGGCATEQAQEACASYGYSRGTPQFAACVQTEVEAQRQRMMAVGATLQGYGASLQAPPVASGVHTYVIGGRHVTCSTFGGVTNCY